MNDENQDDENNSEVVITAPSVKHGKPEAGKPGVIDRRYCPTDLFLFVHAAPIEILRRLQGACR